MRSVFLAAVLATTFLTPVAAAELTAESQIDAVTVYPQGAEVTRVATADLERGDHTLVLDNLPADVDPQSIRVDGAATGGSRSRRSTASRSRCSMLKCGRRAKAHRARNRGSAG